MSRFYGGLLGDGLAPAAALRAAQRSLLRTEGWEAPYFWAGFVLQGEGAAGRR
jgi:CHAT domain-containing protein